MPLITELKQCPFCGITEFPTAYMLCNRNEKRVRVYSHPQNGCILAGVQFKATEWNKRITDK